MKLPKTLGACIDYLYNLRSERLSRQKALEAEIDKLKDMEQQLKDHILAKFSKADIEGAKGEVATAAVQRTEIPLVKDWTALYAYIEQTGAFDLLEKRVARLAWRDRVEGGEPVPGVEPFTKVDLSLTKVSK